MALNPVSVTPADHNILHVPITADSCKQDINTATPLKDNDKMDSHGIPKLIHQIWTTTEVPDEWRSLQQHCKQLNSQYEYMLWTHEHIDKFIEEHYTWFLPTYMSYSYPMERLDAGRYFILYHYGGVYIDMDIECKVSFDDILMNISKDAQIVLGATPPVGVTSSFLAAKRHHVFMRLMTQDLMSANHWYILPYWTVVLSTGPLYVWRSYIKFPCKEQIHVIPVDLHTSVYLDHKHLSSWHSWDGSIMVWLGEHYRLLVVFVMGLLISLIIIMTKKVFPNCGKSDANQISIIFAR